MASVLDLAPEPRSYIEIQQKSLRRELKSFKTGLLKGTVDGFAKTVGQLRDFAQ